MLLLGANLRSRKLLRSHKNRAIRDEDGNSLRASAFKLFDRGETWQAAAEYLEAKPETVRRYYHDWLKLPPEFEQAYKHLRILMKNPESKNRIVNMISEALKMNRLKVEEIFRRPWGLKTLMLEQHGLRAIEIHDTEEDAARNIYEWATFQKFKELCDRSGLSMDDQLKRINYFYLMFKEEMKHHEVKNRSSDRNEIGQ
jgi:hypothetical protein